MPEISPELALALRLRQLSTALTGSPVAKTPNASLSLATRLEHFLEQYSHLVGGSEVVKRFIANYDKNAPLLSVPVASDATETLSPVEQAIYVLDNEAEIVQVERELREIQVLADRGVAEAGSLDQHERFKGDLEALSEPIDKLATSMDALEAQTTQLLAAYNDYITNTSETFVTLNATLNSLEQVVDKLSAQ